MTKPGVLVGVMLAIVAGFAYGYWESTGGSFLRFDLDSGWAGLIGALIGSGMTAIATVTVTNRQVLAQRQLAEDERLFDTRKDAYAAAIEFFMTLLSAREHGIAFPNNAAQHERAHEISAELTLLSSNALIDDWKMVLGQIATKIPQDLVERRAENERILHSISALSNTMRRELGTDN